MSSIDPEKVISKMAQQVGQLSAELAICRVALDAAEERLAELEKPAEGGD